MYTLDTVKYVCSVCKHVCGDLGCFLPFSVFVLHAVQE